MKASLAQPIQGEERAPSASQQPDILGRLSRLPASSQIITPSNPSAFSLPRRVLALAL